MLLEVDQHLAEFSSAALLGRFDIGQLVGNRKPFARSVLAQEAKCAGMLRPSFSWSLLDTLAYSPTSMVRADALSLEAGVTVNVLAGNASYRST
jgi:hypothetical protein